MVYLPLRQSSFCLAILSHLADLISVSMSLINGAALDVQSLRWTNILQEAVPGERQGRVVSIDLLGSYVLLPVGFAITGRATNVLGPATVFVIGGGITACLGLRALTHPAVRRFD